MVPQGQSTGFYVSKALKDPVDCGPRLHTPPPTLADERILAGGRTGNPGARRRQVPEGPYCCGRHRIFRHHDLGRAQCSR